MTMGEDRNKDQFENRQLCPESSRFVTKVRQCSRGNASALPIRIANSLFLTLHTAS